MARPDVYSIKQGVNVYEMLTMAGGLSKETGKTLYIKTTQLDPETGRLTLLTKAVDIEEMFNPTSFESVELQNSLRQMFLGNGDSLLVEKAGVVYIDGAV